MCPQPGAGAWCDADGGYVLAGESADEDVRGFDLALVKDGDVAEARGVVPVPGEDSGDERNEFVEPHCSGVEKVLDGEVEAAVAAEGLPDPESWVAVASRSCTGAAPVTSPVSAPRREPVPNWSPVGRDTHPMTAHAY